MILQNVFSSSQVIYLKEQLVILLSELTNLTARVEILESGPEKYIKLEFDLLRVELREFELLVTQLKASINSSSPVFDSLYNEVSVCSFKSQSHIFKYQETLPVSDSCDYPMHIS